MIRETPHRSESMIELLEDEVIRLIRDSEDEQTVYTLLEKMWPLSKFELSSFVHVIVNLLEENKIMFSNFDILWIAIDNPKLQKLVDKSVRIR